MNTKRIVIAAWVLGLAVVSLVGMGFVPTQGIALPTDDGPKGGSGFEDMVASQALDSARVTTSITTITHDTDRTVFVTAPERAPLAGEAKALDRFLHQGGTAVLFVASHTWNDVLTPYGVTLHGSLLLDSRDEGRPSSFPVNLPDRLGGGQMVLVNATAITSTGPDVETVTPERELVLDLDGDRRISVPPDTAGNFATIADVNVGDGTLVVIGSGDAVLNENIDRHLDGTQRLVEELVGSRGVFLDTSSNPMGLMDALREPARILTALFHASWIGLVAGGGLFTAAVYASPRIQAVPHEASSLDERSEETKEWLKRGDP